MVRTVETRRYRRSVAPSHGLRVGAELSFVSGLRGDHASLVIERTVEILTEIALKVTIAAVLDRTVRTAARTGNAVTPANLL